MGGIGGAGYSGWGARCDPSPGVRDRFGHEFLDLLVVGNGFEQYEGVTVRALTHAWDDVGRVFAVSEATIVGGTFEMHWAHAYEPQNYQPVHIYADVDANKRCDPAIDRVWSQPTGAGAGGDFLFLWYDRFAVMGPQAADVCSLLNAC